MRAFNRPSIQQMQSDKHRERKSLLQGEVEQGKRDDIYRRAS